MKTFYIKVALFLFPLSIIFVFPVAVIYLGKEYITINDIVVKQQTNPSVIFNFAYRGFSQLAYKQSLIQNKKPEVIVLGTSRVMEIRKEFFKNPNLFVNAGCPCVAKTLGDIDFFVDTLEASSSVKLILLGLDREMFYKKDTRSLDIQPSVAVGLKDALFLMFKNIYLDYASHKYTLDDLYVKSKTTENIGLSAILYGNGFRSDGSYLYNKEQENKTRNEFVRGLIETEKETIYKTNHVTTQKEAAVVRNNLEKLDRMLNTLQSKGIVVVGFTLPYPESVYTTMKKSPGIFQDSVTNLPNNIADVFSKHHMSFFDVYTPSVVGGKDTEFIDSLHGTDLLSLRVLVYISERSADVSRYVYIQSLRDILHNTKNDFLSF